MNSKIKVNILDFNLDDIYPAEILIEDGLISNISKLDFNEPLDYEGILLQDL